MSDLDVRIDIAVEWLLRSQQPAVKGHGMGWGWAWIADATFPNAQDTSEVVCALRDIGRPVPRCDDVLALIRYRLTDSSIPRTSWALIDLAWRLRALLALGLAPDEPDVRTCMKIVCAAQDARSGGWRMSSRIGPLSITATTVAIMGLIEFVGHDDGAAVAVTQGISYLASVILSDDPSVRSVHAAARIAMTLSDPKIVALAGKEGARARRKALDHVMAGLRAGKASIEEDSFVRDGVTYTWRHLGLHLAIGAIAAVDGELIFDPAFRSGLIELLALQEVELQHVNYGGFLTSREGFVTTYATVQAVDAMWRLRHAIIDQVNPGRVFDIVCYRDGRHPSDPQRILRLGHRTLIINGYAGTAFLVLGTLVGTTIVALSLGFSQQLGKVGYRALVVWGALIVALGVYTAISTALPGVSRSRVAALLFAAFTAVVLPVVSFLLT